jgi:hypothetical protein
MIHLREVSLMLAFNDDDEVAKNELNFGRVFSRLLFFVQRASLNVNFVYIFYVPQV